VADNVDVVVGGAGLSGLTTAYRLVQQGVDGVVVLEAKDRVGGRTLTTMVDGTVLDAGATIVSLLSKKSWRWHGPRRPHSADSALEQQFGPQARDIEAYQDTNWADEPFQSGRERGLAPGVLTRARTTMATTVGGIRWAGVETARR
jgi:monoamine oxidase